MIEGSFKDVSLPALLQLLCFESTKSFRVNLQADNQKGYIFIRQGSVIAAHFGILAGEDAVCEFQSWAEGSFHAEQVAALADSDKNLRFEFQPNLSFIQDCAVLSEHHIGLNSELTGSQFFGSSEWKQLVHEHPLDRECFSVLAWLREGRKMRQALREFGFDIVRATSILAALVRTRSIQVIRPGASAIDQADKVNSERNAPTTGGQQEAAAALAREAARALESATDVADEAFTSQSFKAQSHISSATNDSLSAMTSSQTNSYSLDTQSRSSIEARLRAKKNSGSHSLTDIKAFHESKQPSKQSGSPPPVAPVASEKSTGEKKQKPDLFSVLQSRSGRVVPDLGDSAPAANSGQVTASTHNLPSLKQAKLKTDQPELLGSDVSPDLSPDYSKDVTSESESINNIRKATPHSSVEMTVDEAMIASSYAWKGPSEPSPMSVNWPKNIPTNTFQNLPAQSKPANFGGAVARADEAATRTMTNSAQTQAKADATNARHQPFDPDEDSPAVPAARVSTNSAVSKILPAATPHVTQPLPPGSTPKVTAIPPLPVPDVVDPMQHMSTDEIQVDDPRLVAKTLAMPLVAFDIERLLLTTFLATQFGKLALGNPSLDPHRRQTLMDAEYGKSLAVSIEDGTRLPSAILASYRYCLDRGYIETHDPVIPLTADLLLGRMEIDQYLLQRRRLTGDELRDLVKISREEGIKLTQLLVKSGFLTEADLETLGREQKRFAYK